MLGAQAGRKGRISRRSTAHLPGQRGDDARKHPDQRHRRHHQEEEGQRHPGQPADIAPVGFNLFVLQGMTRRNIGWLARVTLPFFFLMILAIGLIWVFPGIVTALPSRM